MLSRGFVYKGCPFKGNCQEYESLSNICNNQTDDYRLRKCLRFENFSEYIIREIANGNGGDNLIEKLKKIKF